MATKQVLIDVSKHLNIKPVLVPDNKGNQIAVLNAQLFLARLTYKSEQLNEMIKNDLEYPDPLDDFEVDKIVKKDEANTNYAKMAVQTFKDSIINILGFSTNMDMIDKINDLSFDETCNTMTDISSAILDTQSETTRDSNTQIRGIVQEVQTSLNNALYEEQFMLSEKGVLPDEYERQDCTRMEQIMLAQSPDEAVHDATAMYRGLSGKNHSNVESDKGEVRNYG